MEEILEQAREFYGEEPQWSFVKELVKKVVDHLHEIDAAIIPHAQEWTIARMNIVDRTVLRLGVAEMMFFPDIPFQVTINEAVELAKKYGGNDSGGFVNGILSSVHADRAASTQP